MVPLQPTATAKGIIADPKGRPSRGPRFCPWMVLTTEQRELTMVDLVRRKPPPLFYSMSPWSRSLRTRRSSTMTRSSRASVTVGAYADGTWSVHPIPPLKPGEVATSVRS